MSLTRLVPQETTVRIQQDAAVWGEMERGYGLLLRNRHNHWHDRRQRVGDAMILAMVPCSRRSAFGTCGSGGWVLKNRDDPADFAIVPQFCHDRFCDPCSRQRAWIIRKNLCEHLSSRQPEANVFPTGSNQKPNEKPTATPCRFVTLTLKSKDEPLQVLLDRLRDSFTQLRKTVFWRSCVKGGAAFLEVKRSRRGHRWHPHLHIICHGSWISKQQLQDDWHAITGDSFIVDVGLIKSDRDVSRYITKYVTKGFDDRTFDNPEHLVEAILAMRGRKLCGAFGDWSKLRLLRVETDANWELLCPLDEVADLARSGSLEAAAVVRFIDAADGFPGQFPDTARAPPEFFAVGLVYNPRPFVPAALEDVFSQKAG